MANKLTIKGAKKPMAFTAEQEKRAAALGVQLPPAKEVTLFEVDDSLAKRLTEQVNELIVNTLREELEPRIGAVCEERNGAGSFEAMLQAHKKNVSVFASRTQGSVYRKLYLDNTEGIDADSILSGNPASSASTEVGAESF